MSEHDTPAPADAVTLPGTTHRVWGELIACEVQDLEGQADQLRALIAEVLAMAVPTPTGVVVAIPADLAAELAVHAADWLP